MTPHNTCAGQAQGTGLPDEGVQVPPGPHPMPSTPGVPDQHLEHDTVSTQGQGLQSPLGSLQTHPQGHSDTMCSLIVHQQGEGNDIGSSTSPSLHTESDLAEE